MSRPIAPIVRMRLAQRIQTARGIPPGIAVIEATKLIQFVESAGLDIVMPEWLPVQDDHPEPAKRRTLTWDDLPKPSAELLELKPWRPYDA